MLRHNAGESDAGVTITVETILALKSSTRHVTLEITLRRCPSFHSRAMQRMPSDNDQWTDLVRRVDAHIGLVS